MLLAPELVSNVYLKLKENVVKFRSVMGRPLTLTEKILSGHFNEINEQNFVRWKRLCFSKPDRIALQDATAQMADASIHASWNKTKVAVPTTVHCDHLIQAKKELL